jgi:hypothetical protein
MNYVPPRGQCNHKPSLLAAKCPCLRFMLHPLKVRTRPRPPPANTLVTLLPLPVLTFMKSSSSYECDGCGHHASFHTMENKTEDEIRKRWEVEAKERAERAEREEAPQRPKKRVRAIEFQKDDGVSGRILDGEEKHQKLLELLSRNKTVPRKKATARLASTRAKNSISEIMEDDEVVELD